MTLWRLTIQHPAMWWGAVVLSVGIAAGIAYVHHQPPREVVSDRGAYIDPTGGPCPPERAELACARWRAAGWTCIVGPGGTEIQALDLPGRRGAHGRIAGRDVIGMAPDACGRMDPTLEHELGHLLGLGDCPGCRIGDAMGTPAERAGLRIPRRAQ